MYSKKIADLSRVIHTISALNASVSVTPSENRGGICCENKPMINLTDGGRHLTYCSSSSRKKRTSIIYKSVGSEATRPTGARLFLPECAMNINDIAGG